MSDVSDFFSDDSKEKESPVISDDEESVFSVEKYDRQDQVVKEARENEDDEQQEPGQQQARPSDEVDNLSLTHSGRMYQEKNPVMGISESKPDNMKHSAKRKTKTKASSSQSKKKRAKVSWRHFMDTEALVDDSDEEDEDYEEDYESNMAFLDEAKEAQKAEQELGLIQRRRLAKKDDEISMYKRYTNHLETAIGSLEDRYKNETLEEGEDDDITLDDMEDDELNQDDDPDDQEEFYASRALLPDTSRSLMDIRDVQLWKIRTAKGINSQDVVISIMNKFVYMKHRQRPFGIFSAFAPHGIRGHVYIEANNLAQIKYALSGLRSIILSSIKIVPLNEMNSVFGMGERSGKAIHRNELVRVRGGLYSGDLAQVTGIDELGGNVWIRVIPRLSLNDLFEPKSQSTEKTRHVARLIPREEIEEKGGIVKPGPRWGTFRFAGRVFTDSGYLLKKVTRQMLITGPDVAVTEEEVKEFGRGMVSGKDELGNQEELLAALSGARNVVFNTGDKIIIHSGDVAGVKGVVVSLDGRTVNVQLENKTLQDVISVEAHAIVKHFQIGDSVKVVSGSNRGASGLITAVDLKERTATVFYPVLGKPFISHLDDLQSQPDIGMAMASTLGGFSVGDLVQLSERETGVIVRIDAGGAFIVLTPDNKVEAVPLSRVAGKRSNEFAVALDRNNVKFGMKTTVMFTNNRKKITGRVCHIWKSHVFVKLANKDEGHYGFMACDSKDVSVRLSDGCSTDLPTWSKHSSLPKYTPGPTSERPNRGGFRGRGGRSWIGSRVRIISGRNKGSFGVILGLESGGRLRIRLSQNDLAACFNRNELIILDEPNHQRFGRRSIPDQHTDHKKVDQEKKNNWTDYFQKIRDSQT